MVRIFIKLGFCENSDDYLGLKENKGLVERWAEKANIKFARYRGTHQFTPQDLGISQKQNMSDLKQIQDTLKKIVGKTTR